MKNIKIGKKDKIMLLKQLSDAYLIESSEIIITNTPKKNKRYVKLLKLNSSFDLIINKDEMSESIGK